jgi:hypothetical protein
VHFLNKHITLIFKLAEVTTKELVNSSRLRTVHILWYLTWQWCCWSFKSVSLLRCYSVLYYQHHSQHYYFARESQHSLMMINTTIFPSRTTSVLLRTSQSVHWGIVPPLPLAHQPNWPYICIIYSHVAVWLHFLDCFTVKINHNNSLKHHYLPIWCEPSSCAIIISGIFITVWNTNYNIISIVI